MLYTLHGINQSRSKRIKGIINDVKSLIHLKEACPECSCFIIILEVGNRYLYNNLDIEIAHIRPPVSLKGDWYKPSTKVAFGVFEIEGNDLEIL